MFKTKLFIKATLGFALVFCGLNVSSQTTSAAQAISIAQGLSQGMVFDLLQDREGFIWVATKNGLNRYDGYGFKVFTNDPYDTSSLSSNTVVTLYEDSRGRIWAGTDDAGMNVYDKKTGRFFRIQHDEKNPASLSSNRMAIAPVEIAGGRMVVPATDAGLNIISLADNFAVNNGQPFITRVNLPNNAQVHSLGRDTKGTVWVQSTDSITYTLNPANNALTQICKGHFFDKVFYNGDGTAYVNEEMSLWDGNNFYPLFYDKKNEPYLTGNLIATADHKLWLAYDGRLREFDLGKWQPQKPLSWGQSTVFYDSLSHLRTFMIDKSGLLWAGTRGYGLRKYNLNDTRFGATAAGCSTVYIVPMSNNNAYICHYPSLWRDFNGENLAATPYKAYYPAKKLIIL